MRQRPPAKQLQLPLVLPSRTSPPHTTSSVLLIYAKSRVEVKGLPDGRRLSIPRRR